MDLRCDQPDREVNEVTEDMNGLDNENSSDSPVFKCEDPERARRSVPFDSSDYDIPSYQMNQLDKSETSSNCGSDTSDSVIPSSLPFSPIRVPSKQFQPPSVHSLGTVAKASDISCRNSVRSFPQMGISSSTPCGSFEGLKISDEEISWAGSIASTPPKQVPSSEFDTVEKAPLSPEERGQNIKPRTLFPSNTEEAFDFQPILPSPESEDEAYKSSARISDASTLNQLEVRSLTHLPEQPAKNNTQKRTMTSTVTAPEKGKPAGVQKNKGNAFDEASGTKQSDEFSARSSKSSNGEEANFYESDLVVDEFFKNIPLGCLDELCGIIVPKESDQSAEPRSVDCEKIPANTSGTEKRFYSKEGSPGMDGIPWIETEDFPANLQELLVEQDPVVRVNNFVDEGIVLCYIFGEDLVREYSDDQLDSDNNEVEENNNGNNSNVRNEEGESIGWERMKDSIPESDLNVSEEEICRRLDDLERMLACQESKDSKESRGAGGSDIVNADVPSTSGEGRGKWQGRSKETAAAHRMVADAASVPSGSLTKKMLAFQKSADGKTEIPKDSIKEGEGEWDGPSRISRGAENARSDSLEKAGGSGGAGQGVEAEELLVDRRGFDVSSGALERAQATLSFGGFTTGSGRKMTVTRKGLERAKALLRECEEGCQGGSTSGNFSDGFDEEMDAPRGLLAGCRADATEKSEKSEASLGFVTCSGKQIPVSAEALRRGRSLMRKCDEDLREKTERSGTELSKNKKPQEIPVASKGLGEADNFWANFEESPKDVPAGRKGFFPDSGRLGSSSLQVFKGSEQEVGGSSRGRPLGVTDDVAGRVTAESSGISVEEEYPGSEPFGFSTALGNKMNVSSRNLKPGGRFDGQKRQKLELEEEKTFRERSQAAFAVPYGDWGRSAGAKRPSDGDSEASAPVKRQRSIEMAAAEWAVREGRARRRREQQCAAERKESVKPYEGLHLSMKSMKQMSWMEAVKGSRPEVYSEEVLKGYGVHEDVVRVTIENAGSFGFKGDSFLGKDHEHNVEGIGAGDGCRLILSDENRIGVEECKRAFLASGGVQPNLVPEGWVENHYKWIVWKLAHYEKSFPQYFAGTSLTPNNVMLQLKYRYDREIDRNERSALKKILERDDAAAKRLVLCVCGIEKIEGSDPPEYELKLTDGWYSCSARFDPAMTAMVDKGLVLVGSKLLIQGAVLVNCEQGVSPLEAGGDVYLKISTNSTRRARWDTKLGFQKNPQRFPVSLKSILNRGGLVGRIEVILVRKYPVLYREKLPSGQSVTRNRCLEDRVQEEYRRMVEARVETLKSETLWEMRTSDICSMTLPMTEDACEVDEPCDLPEGSSGPRAFKNLTEFEYLRNKFIQELEARVNRKIEEEKLGKRNVTQLLRIKVVDLKQPDYDNPAVLTVWRPHEDLIDLLKEGDAFSLVNLTVSNSMRCCRPLHLHTTQNTQITAMAQKVEYAARRMTPIKDLASMTRPLFDEIDLVGVIVSIKKMNLGSRASQVVYLADSEMNLVAIVFWGSIEDYGWEYVLNHKSIVACSNLQWRRSSLTQAIPSVFVDENSFFTENPKDSYLKEALEKFNESLPVAFETFNIDSWEKVREILLRESAKNATATETNDTAANPCGPQANGFGSKPTATSTPLKLPCAKTAPDGEKPSTSSAFPDQQQPSTSSAFPDEQPSTSSGLSDAEEPSTSSAFLDEDEPPPPQAVPPGQEPFTWRAVPGRQEYPTWKAVPYGKELTPPKPVPPPKEPVRLFPIFTLCKEKKPMPQKPPPKKPKKKSNKSRKRKL